MEQVYHVLLISLLTLYRTPNTTLNLWKIVIPQVNAWSQADNRPVDRAVPSLPEELPRGHPNVPINQEAASDRDETSNVSTSERSESFTQALQKLQARLKSPPVIWKSELAGLQCLKR